MKYKKSVKVLEFELICEKCGYKKTLTWHSPVSVRLRSFNEFIFKTISHNRTRFKCRDCMVAFSFNRATIYRVETGLERLIIYSEEITEKYFERYSVENKSFLENRNTAKSTNAYVSSVEDFVPEPIRKRICPKCGHKYTGTELCPMFGNHYTKRSRSRNRDLDEGQAAVKEFLTNSHRENIDFREDG